jgi:hypothetical protein
VVDKKRGQGKSRSGSSRGVSQPEFLDSAGVNSRETAVGAEPGREVATKPGTMGRMVEKALANPTLLIAGLAALPVLFVVWGLTRRRQRPKDDEPSES